MQSAAPYFNTINVTGHYLTERKIEVVISNSNEANL